MPEERKEVTIRIGDNKKMVITKRIVYIFLEGQSGVITLRELKEALNELDKALEEV